MPKKFTIVKKSRKIRKNKMSKKNVQSKRNVGSGRSKGEQSIFFGIPINFEEFCRITKYTERSTDIEPMTRFLKGKRVNLEVNRIIRDQYVLGYPIEKFSYYQGEEEGEEGFKNIDELIDELRDKRDQFQDELSTLNSEIDKVYLYPFEGIEVNKDDEEYLEKMYRKPEPYIFNLASTQS
jgi:vacuolar-type H+-ATPase subunit I/STV1